MAPQRKSISEPTLEWSRYGSIMDLPDMDDANVPPFDPPANLYLQEVIVSLRGSTSDTVVQQDARHGSDKAKLLVDRVQAMSGIIAESSEAAQNVCLAVLWLAFQCLFRDHAPPDLLQDLRSQLARGWYLLTLETGKHFPRDTAGRDWANQALPFMFAQAVYRIICDAFEEDRKHVIAHASHLIDKLNIMAHYEVTGFQLNAETGQKCRRQLFQKRVVKHPHTDQLAFVRGQKRQEMLETHKDNGDPVLTFGQSDGVPLEESQLQHVIQNRMEAVQTKGGGGSTHSGTKIFPVADVWVVPYELSVDRYDDLASTGVGILSRQLHELACCMRKPHEEAEVTSRLSHNGCASAPSLGTAPTRLSEKEIATARLAKGGWMQPEGRGKKVPSRGAEARGSDILGATGSTATGRPSTTATEESRPGTSSDMSGSRCGSRQDGGSRVSWGRGSMSRTSMRAIGTMAKLSQRARDKEKAIKERKQHQESMYIRLKDLHQVDEMQSRELWTTWVSPATQTLCGEDSDRFLLQKVGAQGMHLKMNRVALFHEPRSSSPATPTGAGKAGKDTPTTPRRRTASPGRGFGGSSGRSIRHSVVQDSGGATSTGQLPRVGTSPAPGASAAASSRDATGGAVSPPHHPVGGIAHAQTTFLERSTSYQVLGRCESPFALEQPAPVSQKVIVQRLQQQANAFQHSTFAEYMKEYHIFTDTPKIRIDEKRLRAEEHASLSKAKSLGLHRRAQKRNHLERILLANVPDQGKPSKSH